MFLKVDYLFVYVLMMKMLYNVMKYYSLLFGRSNYYVLSCHFITFILIESYLIYLNYLMIAFHSSSYLFLHYNNNYKENYFSSE